MQSITMKKTVISSAICVCPAYPCGCKEYCIFTNVILKWGLFILHDGLKFIWGIQFYLLVRHFWIILWQYNFSVKYTSKSRKNLDARKGFQTAIFFAPRAYVNPARIWIMKCTTIDKYSKSHTTSIQIWAV